MRDSVQLLLNGQQLGLECLQGDQTVGIQFLVALHFVKKFFLFQLLADAVVFRWNSPERKLSQHPGGERFRISDLREDEAAQSFH